jgi:hypothetical protein
VGAVTELPMTNPSGTAFNFRDRPTEPGRLPPMIEYQTITPGYFKTMRIQLRRGTFR